MGLFIKKQKVFISHKRVDGTASPEAVLIKQLLDENRYLETFMDVHEDTLGEFPAFLNKKIGESDSFVFLIPSDGNVSFLFNRDGWVYKELFESTSRYLMSLGNNNKNSIQILPVTFSKTFEWPDNLPKSISTIVDFKICRLNLNDQLIETHVKLAKALNIQPRSRINWWGIAIFAALVTIVSFFGVISIKHIAEERKYDNRIEFIKNSFEGRIANRIQPALIIPLDERTQLVDSIYNFFELRDKYYNDIKTMPVIKPKYINADMFSKTIISETYDAYINNLILGQTIKDYIKKIINGINNSINRIDIDAVNQLDALFMSYDFEKMFDIYAVIEDILDDLLKISDGVLNKMSFYKKYVNDYFKEGNYKKALKYAARISSDYTSWYERDQTVLLLEEMAKLCNLYLTGSFRRMPSIK